MKSHPQVAVITPVFNQVHRTVRFLEHFRQVRYPNFRIIVVDDGSTDDTVAVVERRFPWVELLHGDGNRWWSGATNIGVRHILSGNCDYVLTLNNDTRVRPAYLTRLVQTARANPRTIVGSRIHFASEPNRVWAVGSTMHWLRGALFHLAEHGRQEGDVLSRGPGPWPVQTLTGCGTLVPAACYREVGLYDSANYPQYHADTEFILRARRHGYHALVDPRAVVWNDTENTIADTVCRYADFLLSPRSPVYWRPLLAIHREYCPPWLVLPSLLQHYARFFWYHAPALRAFKQLLRRAFARRQAIDALPADCQEPLPAPPAEGPGDRSEWRPIPRPSSSRRKTAASGRLPR